MARFSLRKKKEQPIETQEEPVFPDYPRDTRSRAGRKPVADTLRAPQRPTKRPAQRTPIPRDMDMEDLAPTPQAPLEPEPDYEEEPESEEPAETGEQDLDAIVDYLIENNLVEGFYTKLQEKLELRELYKKIVKARKLYGRRS